MAQIEAAGREKEADREGVTRQDHEAGRGTWQHHLINTIALNNFCRAVVIRNGTVAIVGKPHNAEVVRFMFDYLAREIDRLANLARRKREVEVLFGEADPILRPRVWLNNFRIGAVNVIAQRLDEQSRHNRQQSVASEALVTTERAALVAKMRELFPRLQNVKSRYTLDVDGYQAGKDAGAQIGLHAGAIGSQSNPAGRRLLT